MKNKIKPYLVTVIERVTTVRKTTVRVDAYTRFQAKQCAANVIDVNKELEWEVDTPTTDTSYYIDRRDKQPVIVKDSDNNA